MTLELPTFANGDTDYVAKLNTISTDVSQSINAILAIIARLPPGTSNVPVLRALFGSTNAVIGNGSYALSTAAPVLTVAAGYVWIPDREIFGYRTSSLEIDFTGKSSATYYISIDSLGNPFCNTYQDTAAIHSVVWTGSAFGTLTRLAAVAWGDADWQDGKSSAVTGVTAKQTFATRIEDIELAQMAVLEKTVTTADVTLTTDEAMTCIAVYLSGTLTGNRSLIIPAKAKPYIVLNECDGAYTVTVKVSGQTGPALNSGDEVLVYCDDTTTYLIAGGGTTLPSIQSGDGGKVVAVKGDETGYEYLTNNPGAFTGLSDVPSSYSGQAGKIPAVNSGETALEFIVATAASFIGLTDTPADYTDDGGKLVAVNTSENALEFVLRNFLGLTDTPNAYTGQALKMVSVNAGETALEFSSNLTPAAFLGLLDVFESTYSSAAGLCVMVKANETGLEFGLPSIAVALIQLTDGETNYTGAAGKVLRVKATEDGWEWVDPSASGTFLGLSDTPNAYTGAAYKAVVVNGAENALAFADNVVPTTFLSLQDVWQDAGAETRLTAYTGHGGKTFRIAPEETGIELCDEAYVVDVDLNMPSEFSVEKLQPPGSGTMTFNVTKATETANAVFAGPTSGDAAAPTFRALVAADLPEQPYVIAGFYPGTPTASALVLKHRVPVAVELPASLTNSNGDAETAATAQTDFDITVNGVSKGTMRFAASGTQPSFLFTNAVSLAAGDVLRVIAPGTPDATLADIAVSLLGSR